MENIHRDECVGVWAEDGRKKKGWRGGGGVGAGCLEGGREGVMSS